MIKTYAARPDAVEAVQYDGTNAEELITFCPNMVYYVGAVLTFTAIPINAGDWVMKDFGGVFGYMSEEMFPKYYNVPGGPESKPAPEAV